MIMFNEKAKLLSTACLFSEAFPEANKIRNTSKHVDVDGTGRHTCSLNRYDLLINDVANVFFPSNLLFHSIKCATYITVTLGVRLWWLRNSMSWALTLSIISIIIYSYRRILMAIFVKKKPWLDSRVTHINRLPTHTHLRFFSSCESARVAACLPSLRDSSNDGFIIAKDDESSKDRNVNTPFNYESNNRPHPPVVTSNVLCLDSDTKWRFKLFPTVESGLHFLKQIRQRSFFQPSNNNNINSTQIVFDATIKVPSNWTLQGFDDVPIYTNIKYPFQPRCPPLVPHKNPTGVYQYEFSLPKAWVQQQQENKNTNNNCEYTLLLHGVESACFIYLNGNFVGFSKDSRLPAEFDITPSLKCSTNEQTTNNVLHILVCRFCDGSYLEDQDHWCMAGIYRSVEIVRRPYGADIIDYTVQADMDGQLSILVQLRTSPNGVRLDTTTNRQLAAATQTRGGVKLIAQLFSDDQISPHGGCKIGNQIWESSCHIDNSTALQKTCLLSGVVNDVQLWSAETPKLYSLVLCLKDDFENNVVQAESCRVGFRSMHVKEGAFLLNSKRIMICGVNRHEHSSENGKTLTIDSMIEDIVLLKQNNFNAVRTSHYPNASEFYRLCDYFGMYVCDEANVEVHGIWPMGKLAQDWWGWKEAIVTRVTRMVQRDRNHASIIMWSLGNEAGRGRNLLEARRQLRLLDKSRPILYESGGALSHGVGRSSLTDFVFPMYTSVGETFKLGTGSYDDRPVILCEYSHSMGNSSGNLHLYWEHFWQSGNRLQGGFIWDMVDQGLRKVDPETGRAYYAYGGEFGEPHDKQFCCNGLFSPDREPHPAVSECKRVQQPVELELVSGNKKIFLINPSANPEEPPLLFVSIRNRYSFLTLEHISWSWTVTSDISSPPIASSKDGKSVVATPFTLRLNLSGMERKSLEALPLLPCRCWLNVTGSLAEDTSWAKRGHTLVQHQFEIVIPKTANSNRVLDQSVKRRKMSRTSDSSSISVWLDDIEILRVSKSSGLITEYRTPEGVDITSEQHCGIGLSFTRAVTDNDQGGSAENAFTEFAIRHPWFSTVIDLCSELCRKDTYFSCFGLSYWYQWRCAGLNPANPPSIIKCNDFEITPETDSTPLSIKCGCQVARSGSPKLVMFTGMVEYKVFNSGKVTILCKFLASDSRILRLSSLPRFGLEAVLCSQLYRIKYLGRGPHECYPDRLFSADFGVHNLTPEQMHVDYIFPSENGNRCDVTFVCFTDNNGSGVCIKSDSTFNFSAKLHSQQELHCADHTYELEDRKDGKAPIFVHFDKLLMGVGGDCSWRPCVYDEYLIKPTSEIRFEFSLVPLSHRQTDIGEDLTMLACAHGWKRKTAI